MIDDKLLLVMKRAAEKRGKPYDRFTMKVLSCIDCKTTPIDKNNELTHDSRKVDGRFYITFCLHHREEFVRMYGKEPSCICCGEKAITYGG